MNPPFLPPSFPPGPPTAPIMESGPGNFVRYNGQHQTGVIDVANPPPAGEPGPGPADPRISAHRRNYTGSGYGPVGQGTIGVGNPAVATPGPPPAQLRFYVGTDGNLYALENQTGQVFQIAPGGSVQPPVYSPTK